MSPLVHSIISQYIDVIEYLLSVCPRIVNLTDKFGKSPLHFAIESDNVEILELLIRRGADINMSTMHGITPLMFTCSTPKLSQREEFVRILLREGALIDLVDTLDYKTALQFAVTNRHIEVVSQLLVAGADANTFDKGGSTPLTNLISTSARPSLTDSSVMDDVMTIVVLLQQKGAELNSDKCEYSNPLMVATLMKCGKLVEYFLNCGANPNMKFISGITPLHAAVGNRDLQTTRVLLRHNADVAAKAMVSLRGREERLCDAFELAVDLKQWDIVLSLVEHGYNLSKHGYLRDSVYMTSEIPDTLRDNAAMLSVLQKEARTPSPLQKLVVLKARKILQIEISQKVQMLILPTSLKNAIATVENF